MTVYLHVGYPKTATTWLQTRVFATHPSMNYWVVGGPHEWITELISAHDFEFNAKALRQCFESHLKDVPLKPVLISWAPLIGDVYGGGWSTQRNCERLRAVFGKARIIITIRNQIPMIESLYKQYVTQGGVGSIKDFLNLPGESRIRFSWNYLLYDKTVELYHAIFGQNAVKVLLYEELEKKPDNFLERISDYMGIQPFTISAEARKKQENKSLSTVSFLTLRTLNPFIFSYMNPVPLVSRRLLPRPPLTRFLKRADSAALGKLFPLGRLLDKETLDNLQNYYRPGNRALVRDLGLPLAKYGYPL